MKHTLIFLAAFAAGAVLTGARAAPTTKPVIGQHDNNAPINISSDSFQADLNGKTGTWSGNVVVVQADTKMRANSVRMATVNGKADKVLASGNVVLKKGKDVMRGAQLTVNLATGQAVLGGGAKTSGASGGRVQGVFIPNSQQAGPQ